MPRLTARQIDRAAPGRHSDGEGLYLLVGPTGARSWVLRVQVEGRRRDIGIGSVAQYGLAEARDRARELRKAAKEGRDPIAVRDKARSQAPSFEVAAQQCHDHRGAGWSARHAESFLSVLRRHAFPKIGRMRVDSIDESDILTVLSPIWTDKPAIARKVRQHIATTLDFAKGKGWRLVGAPRDGLRPLLSKQSRPSNFAAMPYADIPSFVDGLRNNTATAGRLALLFVIATAARSGEVRGTRWSHIDLEKGLWSRPADLMKNREPHVVTLSALAKDILADAAATRLSDRPDELVFAGTSGRPLADMTLLKVVKAEGGPYSVHGFRAAFRTWAAEKAPTVPEAVAEAALAHMVPDAVVRSYQRSKFLDMRRDLLERWGSFLTGQSSVLKLVS
ncbi:tyrosine-type recombinase/integrase [Sphingomicrobium flavum]|uniref:tyrosine-type recombinase/integrase n=1 Tax=Sphingomicrobium flavum TaxID=1229164 RepID=UPI0021AE0140|nr:site-specific integrase [Sphingomicrobium flavum]